MMRMTPKVRAQCERARRPAVMFAIGMALAVPAGSFLMRQDAANRAHPRAGREHRSAYASGYDTTNPHEARAQMTARLATLFGVPMDLAEQIHAAAEKEGIAPRLAFGLVRTESRFKTTAVSPVGAIGLTQVMPKTGAWMRPGTKRSDLFDPGVNLDIGFKYLRELIDQYDGNIRLALTAYNRGPGTVRKVMRHGKDPENGYADMVLTDPSQQVKVPAKYASVTKSHVTSKSKLKAAKHTTKHKIKASVKKHTAARKPTKKFKRTRVYHKAS